MRANKRVLVFLAFSFAVAIWGQGTERQAFLEAEGRFLSKDYSLALDRYDDLIRRWPDSVYAADARYRRAVALYRLGRSEAAYAALSQVEARYRATKYLPYVPFWKAVIEYERADYARAADRFDLLAADPPDDESLRQTLLYLGKARTALDDAPAAIAAFERFLDVSPSSEIEPSALVFLFDLYAKSGAFDRSAALWARLSPDQLDEESRERVTLRAAEALSALGRTTEAEPLFDRLASSGRRDIAVSALQRLFQESRRSGDEARVAGVVVKAENALRTSPEILSEFWLRVGAGAFRDGRTDLARSYFLRIAALLPPERVEADVPIYLARIADREGRVEEAESVLAAAVPFAAGSAALLKTHLGWYRLKLGHWADARTVLTEAVAAAADESLAATARAYLAYALYRLDGAESSLAGSALAESALAALDSPAASLPAMARLRAELLRKSGKAADALTALEPLAAADDEAKVALLSLFFENGRYERVVAAAAAMYDSGGRPVFADQDLRAAAGYLTGVSAAAEGDFVLAVSRLEDARSAGFGRLGAAASWASFYRAWSLYRLSRFAEAETAFSSFLTEFPAHPRAYSALHSLAWSRANQGDYAGAAVSARAAADTAAASADAESLARASYMEGGFRSALKDWNGAIGAYDRAAAAGSGSTSYAVRALYERAGVLEASGRTDAADQAFSAIERDRPGDPLAAESAYRRGELQFRAKKWQAAVDRFAAYRDRYPSGARVDGALYFGGTAAANAGKADAGILLWERLLADFPASRYRFPAILSAARAYREKKDWEAAFRAYTSAIAEFGDRARSAGAAQEADVLRYLMTGLSEKAARLHVLLTREGGAASAPGRAAALELARYYIKESAQREAGLPLIEETIAFRSEDPTAAAEAALLKGDYYALPSVEAWERAALSYLDAVTYAADAKAGALTSEGASVRDALIPDALFRALSARLRAGKRGDAEAVLATLVKNYPTSTWTTKARGILEASR